MKSNEAIETLCAALKDEIGAGDEFELDLGELIGKYRRMHHRHMLAVEAAQLLHLGLEVVAERQHCHVTTAWRRAHKGRKIIAVRLPIAMESA